MLFLLIVVVSIIVFTNSMGVCQYHAIPASEQQPGQFILRMINNQLPIQYIIKNVIPL
jgi:hypothetical protein